MRFALLSHILPPSPSGQAVMLYRLLSAFDPEQYCLLSQNTYEVNKDSALASGLLPARYCRLQPLDEWWGPNWVGVKQFVRLIEFLCQIVWRAIEIKRIVRSEECNLIVACSGDLVNIPAGCLAGHIARVPFYAYIFDDYVYQWVGRERLFAKLCAKWIFIGAAGVITPNPFLAAEYSRRYNINPAIIHNPCDPSLLQATPLTGWPAKKGEVRIVYTGAIYHANYDAFRNLVEAIEELQRPELKLHIYSAQSSKDLMQQSIASESVSIHGHLTYKEAMEEQYRADILFLPLAFDSPIPEVIKTSAPGKMGEYLASGRPILVHAPEDSFVSWYFREHVCGAVADKDDRNILADVIEKLIDDANWRKRLVANAQERARLDFDPAHAQKKLIHILQSSDKHGY